MSIKQDLKNLDQKVTLIGLDELKPYDSNARTHSDEQVDQICASMEKFGWTNPILIDENNGIIAGHGRLMAARKLNLLKVPVITLTGLSDADRQAYILADNKLAENAGWDLDLLAKELGELEALDFDLALTGFSQEEIDELLGPLDLDGSDGSASGALADRFMLAPFSVLNAREGWWQDRKRAWIDTGINSELGRGDNALGFSEAAKIAPYKGKKGKTFGKGLTSGTGSYEKSKHGKCLETGIGDKYGREEMTGTSIFDPVLCEIAYRWFSPQGGNVLDPFAGGSVRGVVAGKLGRQYFGVDLRAEQIAANNQQWEELIDDQQLTQHEKAVEPIWVCGDSRDIQGHSEAHWDGQEADFLFSCPPYADLEVYSDDPADISTLGYAEFKEAYFDIIAKSAALLKQDRFACFVVGEVRGKGGAYYNFVGDTVEAFKAAGLEFYNEAILVTAVGSLPIRAGKQFSTSRKLGKTHQNVLVFCKGDPMKATEACGEIDFSALEGMEAPGESETLAGEFGDVL